MLPICNSSGQYSRLSIVESGEIRMRGNEAREIADLVKEGKYDEVGRVLGADFTKMKPDEFHALLQQAASDNFEDRVHDGNNSIGADLPFHPAYSSGLPRISIVDDSQVDITTPGKIFGDSWADKQTVFLDATDSVQVHHAEKGSTVIAENGSVVVAESGSNVGA